MSMTSYPCKTLFAAGIFLALTVAGCTSDPITKSRNTSFKPNSANEIRRGDIKTIHITKDFVITYTTTGLFGAQFTYGLMEGDYVSVLKDSLGTYYQGPGWCLYSYMNNQTTGNVRRGGLYIPNDKKDPLFYFNADMNGIATVKFGADRLPILAAVQEPNFQSSSYMQNQTATGGVGGVVGAPLGGALIGAITANSIGFLPMPESERESFRALMKYVTPRQ